MKSILIIEDEPDIQELLRAYLEDAGYQTTVAGDGVAALELFGAQIAAFAGVACAVSYLVVGHRSLYPTQVLLSPKSRAFSIRRTERGEQLVRRFDSISLRRIIKFYLERFVSRIIERRR